MPTSTTLAAQSAGLASFSINSAGDGPVSTAVPASPPTNQLVFGTQEREDFQTTSAWAVCVCVASCFLIPGLIRARERCCLLSPIVASLGLFPGAAGGRLAVNIHGRNEATSDTTRTQLLLSLLSSFPPAPFLFTPCFTFSLHRVVIDHHCHRCHHRHHHHHHYSHYQSSTATTSVNSKGLLATCRL